MKWIHHLHCFDNHLAGLFFRSLGRSILPLPDLFNVKFVSHSLFPCCLNCCKPFHFTCSINGERIPGFFSFAVAVCWRFDFIQFSQLAIIVYESYLLKFMRIELSILYVKVICLVVFLVSGFIQNDQFPSISVAEDYVEATYSQNSQIWSKFCYHFIQFISVISSKQIIEICTSNASLKLLHNRPFKHALTDN